MKLNITGSITLEAWIKLNTNLVEQNIMRRGGISDGGYALKVMGSGKLRFVTYASASSLETITSDMVISTTGWHHVAAVFDGSQKRIYIDGTLDKTLTSTFAPGTGSSNLFIGASPSGTQFFNGLVDEVRVTADAVYSGNSFNHLALKRLTGVAGTRGLWRFDRQNAKDCADVQQRYTHGGSYLLDDCALIDWLATSPTGAAGIPRPGRSGLIRESRRLIMKRMCFVLIALLLSAVVSAAGSSSDMQEITESSSFENDMEGWTINGTDVNLGSGSIDWSITRSQENAREGNTSLRFLLNNLNDKGKIWIEKPFSVEPNQIYQVRLEYGLAARESDDGTPLFTLITGVLKKSPTTREDLSSAFKDNAHNGASEPGYKWVDKDYEFALRSDDQGTLYVVIGIWGTWEVGKIFYFDNVRVTITKKPEGTEFYSFENDFEGWTPNGADLELGGGSIGWSIVRIQEFALKGEDGTMSVKFDLDNLNGKGKLWIEKPFLVEPRRKYKVRIDYGLHSKDCGDSPRFRIITGVFRNRPETSDDLDGAYQEKTANVGCTWGWLHKSYDFTIKSKKKDTLYIVIGIWGTENSHRTYNVDSVCVTITPK